MSDFHACLAYWRNSLADADRLGDLPRPDKAAGVMRLPPEALFAGRVDDRVREALDAAFREHGGGDDAERSLPVLLYPAVLEPGFEHARRRKDDAVAPLIVSAVVDGEGQLSASGRHPMIPRTVLRPQDRDGALVVGAVADQDAFLASEPPPEEGSPWAEVLAAVSRLWEAVTGGPLSNPGAFDAFPGFVRRTEAMIALDVESSSGPTSLIGLYDALRAQQRPAETVPLLADLARLEVSHPTGETGLPDETHHLAQMGGDFPLSPSQRAALLAVEALPEGRSLTINGPPGTGKTTLLQSVIATEMARRALAEEEPPVILVASNNNQAVTNVLDAMAEAGTPPAHHSLAASPLAQRWVPDIEAYGLYLAAGSKRQDAAAKGYPYTTRLGFRKDGLDEWESEATVERATAHLLERYRAWSGRSGDGGGTEAVKQARSALREALRSRVECLESVYAAWEAVDAVRRRQEGASLDCLRARCETARGRCAAAAEESAAATERLDEADDALEEHRQRERQIWHAVSAHGLLEALWPLNRLPGVRRRWRARVVYTLAGIGRAGDWTPASRFGRRAVERCLHAWSRERRGQLEADRAAASEALERRRQAERECRDVLAAREQAIEEREAVERDWRARLASIDADPACADEPDWHHVDGAGIASALDRNLRFPVFLLAARYWEADWIVTLRDAIEEGARLDRRGDAASRERLRRFARLTPCFVSTFYTLPRQLDAWRGGEEAPLWGVADLLIVDEAGQVTPEVGATGFAMARRALVVGDQHQIEPVRVMPEWLDRGNLVQAGLAGHEALLDDTGRRACNGNLITAAQSRTAFGVADAPDPGMFLAEHRRCLDPVIDVCNRMVYAGKLVPRRGADGGRSPFAPLGYAHIHSQSTERRGASPCNPAEARVLAKWVRDQRERLLAAYPKADGDLSQVLAVVTPFRAQAEVIREALVHEGVPEMTDDQREALTVGTVHALQGAAAPVVVFSTTYPGSFNGMPFFDRGANMLNVAISRAKDSFLVFGDTRLLDPGANRPSGCLARALFDWPGAEELCDLDYRRVFQGNVDAGEASSSHRFKALSTLEGHRQALARSFARATRDLLIVSPIVTESAIRADDIEDRVRESVQSGTTVRVIASRDFMARECRNPATHPALIRLRDAGAQVQLLPRIHSKVIACDEAYLLLGSFNWLGAVRDANSRYHRREHSVICVGETVPPMIRVLRDELSGAKPIH